MPDAIRRSIIVTLLFVGGFSASPKVSCAQELILAKDVYVDHGDNVDVGNPPCKNIAENALPAILEGLMKGQINIPSLPKFVGAIVELLPAGIGDAIAQTGGDVGKFFKPNRYANCTAVLAQVPPGTTNVSFRASAVGKPCTQQDGPYLICDAGWCAWGVWQDGNYIGATFKNWSHNLARNARFEIYGKTWPQKYRVTTGDNLSKIAQRTYGRQDWPKIYRANKKLVMDPDLIYPNQELSLPAP